MISGVLLVPGGGGKTSLVNAYPGKFCDIDTFWDPSKDLEREMTEDYRFHFCTLLLLSISQPSCVTLAIFVSC